MMQIRVQGLLGLSAIALLLTGLTSNADNWPRFRGVNGKGVATSDKIPAQWKKENILWKVAIPGDGNSSPVIWGDHLFVQSSRKDGKERVLLALNAKSGEVLWQKGVPGSTTRIHKKNSLASSTPATDGERVYVSFWDGKNISITAFDFDGKLLWNRDLGGFVSQHGAGGSPVVYDDLVFFANDQDGKASIIALDAKTGNTVWEKQRPAVRACYSAPLVWERNGKKELIIVSSPEFTAYEPKTGEVIWSWEWKHHTKQPLRVCASPIIVDDTVYGYSGDGGGTRGFIALQVEDKGEKIATTKSWANKRDFPYVPTILAHEGNLYFVNDLGVAGCFNAKSGKKIWFERLPDASFTASPILLNGNIVAPSEEGDVYVIAADPAFRMVARNSLGERIRATPAVANDRLYIRGQDHLFCIGTKE